MRWAVLGAGSWGTALAIHLARAGHDVRLWVRREAAAAVLRRTRRNQDYLPDVELPESIVIDSSPVLEAAEAVLVATPSEHCAALYARLGGLLPKDALVVSATKGLEIESLRRMSEVAAAALPAAPLAVLSGPSFAREVATGQPTAVVVASSDTAVAERLQHALASSVFRVYASDDVIGVELGGALKNVIAVAAGIIDGMGYGHNTIAALVTRGLAEISRLSVALGGRPDTLAGLAGLGDLVLTCTGGLSRNRRLGQALGRGEPLPRALAALSGAPSVSGGHMVAEGVRTTLAACALAERAAVEMPITSEMRDVLHRGRSPREAVESLMLRTLKRE